MAKLIKCCVCNVDDFEEEEIVKYNRRNYCYPCLEEKLKPDEFDKHMFYLHFQNLFNRKPTQLEWIQLDKMIDDSKQAQNPWDWWRLDKMLTYVYEIECLEPSDEHGVVGIMPYLELKASQFFRSLYEAEEANMDVDMTTEVKKIQTSNIKRQSKKPKLHIDLDALLNDDSLID